MTTVDVLLADRYRLVERIASGGMGEVWRGEDTLLGRTVAVKTLKTEYVDDPDFRARFRAEARHAGRLSHAGIASVYDFGETDGSAWLVMELVDGEPLSSLLRRESPLSVDRTLDLVAQTATALHAAHTGGVVHRDVKPGNLLVRPDGVLKVTDFGIASATDAVPLTQTGSVVGTAFYLSPEQAAGRGASPASDVYSLGVVAYECLSGRRPFPGDNPVVVALAHLQAEVPPLRSSIPEPVCELVMRALAKDPADRFTSAADLARRATALRAAVTGGPWVEQDDGGALDVEPPPGVHPDPLPPTGLLRVLEPLRPPGSRARSSRRVVTAIAVVLALLALGLGLQDGGAAPAEPAAAGGTSTTPLPQPVRVAVDPAGYLGKPAAQVRAALVRLGLVPRLAYDGRERPVGTVSGVEPAGQLAAGSGVVVHVVPAPPAAPVRVAPVAPPAPEAAAPVVEQRAGKPGKRKGKGKR
ncbi:MAG: Serine/threonine protein kinase [Frankiales bacterium]|nr:Serine/threonine protein kinase [Frankiales bacterium]